MLTAVSIRARAGRPSALLLGGLWLAFLVEVIVIRPILNRRSDLVIAGQEAPGTDGAHYAYIVADVTMVVLLVALLVVTVRAVLPPRASCRRPTSRTRRTVWTPGSAARCRER